MNVKRFTARTSREALALVRQAFGDEAVVLSNKPCAAGVEVLAMAPEGLDRRQPGLAQRVVDVADADDAGLARDRLAGQAGGAPVLRRGQPFEAADGVGRDAEDEVEAAVFDVVWRLVLDAAQADADASGSISLEEFIQLAARFPNRVLVADWRSRRVDCIISVATKRIATTRWPHCAPRSAGNRPGMECGGMTPLWLNRSFTHCVKESWEQPWCCHRAG